MDLLIQLIHGIATGLMFTSKLEPSELDTIFLEGMIFKRTVAKELKQLFTKVCKIFKNNCEGVHILVKINEE